MTSRHETLWAVILASRLLCLTAVTGRGAVSVAFVAVLAMSPGRVLGYDSKETFRKGAYVLSVEGGGGGQHDVVGHPDETGLEFWNAGVRLSLLPFGAVGRGPFYGALEIGLEPLFQRYTDPVRAHFAGLTAVGRYHFLSLGRFVPYFEVAGAAGGTNLRVREIDSAFTFLVFGGVGASYFLSDHTALYLGYRIQHVSNSNTSSPNRGLESHTGAAGVSFYFP